jgi:hypothetical protein
MIDTPTLVQLKRVHQIYSNGRQRFTAVENVNLAINEGYSSLFRTLRLWQKHPAAYHHRPAAPPRAR